MTRPIRHFALPRAAKLLRVPLAALRGLVEGGVVAEPLTFCALSFLRGARAGILAGLPSTQLFPLPPLDGPDAPVFNVVPRLSARRQARLFCRMAEMLVIRGRTVEAVSAYHEAIDADPRYVEPFVALGRIRRAEGRHAEADAFFERGEALVPRCPKPVPPRRGGGGTRAKPGQ